MPELLNADPSDPVFITEGEKDADRLAALGLVSTTNSGGAGKWRPEYSAHFSGRNVIILPDNDEQGNAHARQVVQSLIGVAGSVKTVCPPGLPPKGDVSDWLHASGTLEQLLELVREAPRVETEGEVESEKDSLSRPSQADRLVKTALAADGIELWHDQELEPYATLRIAGHVEHMPLAGKA